MRRIDINCDCGESFGNWKMGADEIALPRVTSANIACGFHAGDPVTLVRTVKIAADAGVNIGCHPGLPDILGFGRRRMAISAEDAYAYTLYQIGAIQAAARAVGTELSHVKPHGSLMSMLQTDEALAQAYCRAVADAAPGASIYFVAPLDLWVLPPIAAGMGLRVVPEVYPDLSYDDAGNVVVQRNKQHTDISDAVAQIESFLDEGRVRTMSGRWLNIEAESICVHGDGPNLVPLLDAIDGVLAARGVDLRPIGKGETA